MVPLGQMSKKLDLLAVVLKTEVLIRINGEETILGSRNLPDDHLPSSMYEYLKWDATAQLNRLMSGIEVLKPADA